MFPMKARSHEVAECGITMQLSMICLWMAFDVTYLLTCGWKPTPHLRNSRPEDGTIPHSYADGCEPRKFSSPCMPG